MKLKLNTHIRQCSMVLVAEVIVLAVATAAMVESAVLVVVEV
jgi:hypothetical protein